MKSRFYIWLSLVAGLLATSCNDAFMDRQPHTEIGADSYFNTEEDLKMYCYGLINTHPVITIRQMPVQMTRLLQIM